MIAPYQIIRSNRKTLSVCVDCFSRVTVRAPKYCDEGRIFAFLEEKREWICKQQAKMERAGMRLPGENLDGYTFLLLGKRCTLVVTNEKKVRFDDDGRLFVPANGGKTKLVKWLKENALRIFTALTASIAEEMNAKYKTVAISTAKTRWGSCSYDDVLRFTYRLLYAPKEIIEYVIVHELAHTKHKNHSRDFWAEVEKYAPDYKQRRKWLKEHGILMQIF